MICFLNTDTLEVDSWETFIRIEPPESWQSFKIMKDLVNARAFTKNAIFDTLFTEESFFLDEGCDVLIDEFGKDYSNYFSILSLIALSKADRGQIETILNKENRNSYTIYKYHKLTKIAIVKIEALWLFSF